MNTRVFSVVSLLSFLLILLAAVGCRQGVEIGELQTQSETVELGDAGSVQVEIDLAAGELVVSGGAAELLEADFTYNVAEMEPEVAFSSDELTVTHPEVGIAGTLADRDDYRNEWDLRFNDGVPMEMLVNLGAGRGDLTLGNLALSSLAMKAGAGDVTVDLTGAPSLTQLDIEMGAGALLMDLTGDWGDDLNASITAGVGEMTLRLPGSVGVRVDVTEGVGQVNASNLTKDGDAYVNDAYGESEVTLLFDIKAGVGAINLEGEPAPVAAEPAPTPKAPADEEEVQEEEAAVFDEEIANQLQAVLEAAVASPDTNYPGAVLHVSGPELGSWTGAAGLGEVENNTAMRPHDKFRAGSLTKPFISVVVLQLVEEGLFSLDDSMTAVLPESITGKFATSDQITMRMLLNHTGGLPDFLDLAGPEIVANLEKVWEEEEFLDFAAAQEPWFAPGEAQGYSNTDYTLLGMIIEEATGQSWREEMRQRIFEPLNLENTLLPEPDDVTIPGDHAHGYADFGAGVIDATELANASVVGAPGGQSLVTNAEDMSRFVTAVAAGELFQEAGTMGEMLAFVDWPDGNPLSPYVAGYGLGLMQAPFGSGIKGVGHSGDTQGGYHGFVFYLPDQDMIISGAVNTDDFEAGFLLIPRALEVLVPGYSAPEPEPETAFTPPITDAEGNEIPGSIAAIETVTLGGFEQTITLRGVDTTNPVLLFLHGGPGVPSSPWVTWNDFQAELEEHFVVVHWDQRGQGKSYSEALTPEDMHVENFVSDTLALTDILRQRFEQDKIFLWGHSWGSGLGFETLRVNAEPYYAFIASAVRPDWNSTQTMGYEWVLEQARQANDVEAIQALESIQPFDPTNPEHQSMRGQYLSLYRGGDFHTEGLEDAYLDYVLSGQSPEYPAADVEKTLKGIDFARQTLGQEIIHSGYDLFKDFPVSPIPVYFLAGRHDYETPGELAEEYYNFLEAPAKNFTWFENSAHNMMYDEPDKTNQELIRIADEVLAGSVEEGAAQPLHTSELLVEFEAYDGRITMIIFGQLELPKLD